MRFHPRHGRHPFQRSPRLQRQLFVWLLLTIALTGFAAALAFHVVRPEGGRFPFDLHKIREFTESSFAEVWAEPARRRRLAESLANAFGSRLTLLDPGGQTLDAIGEACLRPDISLSVRDRGSELGTVNVCFPGRGAHPWVGLLAFGAAGSVLWAAASVLAYKLTRPLSSLIAVTREIGAGNLRSRVRLRRPQRGELGTLADAINDMAERIERQLNEQRELLAAVSHEVRSPLARMRVSTELLRENPEDDRALTAIESEISEINSLVGKLLASSRLDFGSLARAQLDPVELGRIALERRRIPLNTLVDDSEGARFSGDPTLIARALDNLIDNAEQHGNGFLRLVARRAQPGEHSAPGRAVVFEVQDRGPGFSEGALTRSFEAFYRSAGTRSEQHASLGLGLSLVQRIAKAHEGRAWAKNLPEGGACVSFSVG
jgi:signal transduction histidine kinase